MNRRHFLAATTLAVGTAGCAQITETLGISGEGGGSGASLTPASANEWTTSSSTEGEVQVESGTDLTFSVYKCNRALAETSLMDAPGAITISFDYEFVPEGYWEAPVVEVVADGEKRAVDPVSNIEKKPGTTTTGTYEATVDIEGAAKLILGLRPTEYCQNGDHGDTTLHVENLTVEGTGTGASASTATVSSLTPASADEWSTESTQRGEVQVKSGTDLTFSVYRCNDALATTPLPVVSGALALTFDYEFSPEGYWEAPVVELLANGEKLELERSSGIEKQAGTTTRGTYDATVEVDGRATLQLGLRATDYCGNADHGDTTFRVQNLVLEST